MMISVQQEAISKAVVDAWYDDWETMREAIHKAHERRDGSAQQFMVEGIEHFEKFIVGSSITETPFSVQSEYELMPINGMERLLFIKARPGQYACYRQLDELYKETKKRCARLRMKK